MAMLHPETRCQFLPFGTEFWTSQAKKHLWLQPSLLHFYALTKPLIKPETCTEWNFLGSHTLTQARLQSMPNEREEENSISRLSLDYFMGQEGSSTPPKKWSFPRCLKFFFQSLRREFQVSGPAVRCLTYHLDVVDVGEAPDEYVNVDQRGGV